MPKFEKGVSGNPKGRPVEKKKQELTKLLRNHGKIPSLINKMVKIAMTIDKPKGQAHKDSGTMAKLILERCVPTMRSEERKISSDAKSTIIVIPSETIATISNKVDIEDDSEEILDFDAEA